MNSNLFSDARACEHQWNQTKTVLGRAPDFGWKSCRKQVKLRPETLIFAVWGLGAPLVHAFGAQEVPKGVKMGREGVIDGLRAGLGRPPEELISHRS